MPIYFFACKKGDKFMEKQIIKVPSEEMATSIKVDLARLQYNAIKAENLRNERNAFLKMTGLEGAMDTIGQENVTKKSSELQTQFNAANKCFKDYASNIQKITNDTNPMVTLVFGDIQEYKDYMKEITNINKKIVGDPTIAISEEVLSNILTLFKKTAKKKKDTGEVYITLSGSQLVSILPLYFGMIFLRTAEITPQKDAQKTTPNRTEIANSKPNRKKKNPNLRDDMVRLCAEKIS